MEGMTVGPKPLQKDAHYIASMFNAIAPRYDILNHLLSAGFDRRWRARAIAATDVPACTRLDTRPAPAPVHSQKTSYKGTKA